MNFHLLTNSLNILVFKYSLNTLSYERAWEQDAEAGPDRGAQTSWNGIAGGRAGERNWVGPATVCKCKQAKQSNY